MSQLVVFTDLDGCLLNKADYDYSPAVPILAELRERGVPVVLSSSKTLAEMRVLADELELSDQPLSCENGGAVFWPEPRPDGVEELNRLGADRARILETLMELKERFQFRSFRDLGHDGVQKATDLPMEKVVAACDRHCTEPLLWDDTEDAIDEFAGAIQTASYTLTRGGRFYHVAGHTTKGAAMESICETFRLQLGKLTTISIGDSPIDQSMLDIADIPIGIPWPDGSLNVTIPERGIVAKQDGSAGWAEGVRAAMASVRN